MTAPRLLPPRDLLQQIQGVESGLRRGRGARTTGLIVGAVQVAILTANSEWLTALVETDWKAVGEQWQLLISVFLLALSVLAVGWTRFWLRESQQPFRYTYSVAPFTPVEGDGVREPFVPIHADLRERLSQRIRRLSLLEGQEVPSTDAAAPEAQGVEAARAESHIHIFGYYAIRRRPPDERWLAEVTAWVRVGGPDKPARLAEPVVRFALNEPEGWKPDDGAPPIDPEQYEAILERTYFSVATELYGQIGEDVRRKIELLPNRWFRASALFHEAQDYARSNTLDAYNQARALYEGALAIYDPRSVVLPEKGMRRRLARARMGVRLAICWMRRKLSRWIPKLGRAEVLAARAQIGYANTLLDSWVIAPLSGLRAAATYEAVPIAARAVDRLDHLAGDVPGRLEGLFDARVTYAFAHATLDAREAGRQQLDVAVADDPLRADRDARYLFVRALLEDRLRGCIPLYRRAVELEWRFEAAQFQLAASSELVWRTREKLEASIASAIFEQYGRVLMLNPGNLAAWANSGYMEWLLERPERATRRFEGGLRFKEIKQEAYVAELDHGLARIAAEAGHFELAYRHYHRAVSAILAQGWNARSFADYHFDRISAAILTRFEQYKEAVENHHENPSPDEQERTTKWLRDSVLSFVLFDYSQACYGYFLRTHDYTQLENAYEACKEAIRLNDGFVLAIYLRYLLESDRQEFGGTAPDEELLRQVEYLVPAWPEAAHKLLRWRDEQAQAAREAAGKAQADADKLKAQADQLTERLLDSFAATRYDERISLQSSVEEPERNRRNATRLEGTAEALLEQAAEHEAEARKLSRTLLPHRWLWDAERDGLAWENVTSGAARRELRWERSFEPFHVSVLVAWCRFIADRDEGSGRVDELLDLIEQRFLPSDLELIKFRGERDGASDARNRIELIVEGLLRSDEATFVALKELDPESATAIQAFARVAALPNLSPYLYHWLGKQLLKSWKETGEHETRAAALEAYRKARDIEQPDAKLELADELADLGDEQERDALYQQAADSQDESLRRLEQLVEHFDERGDFERALRLLERASAMDDARSVRIHPREHYTVRRARAQLLSGRFEDARATLATVPEDGGALTPDWRSELVRNIIDREDGAAQARLRDWLGAEQRAALAAGAEDVARHAALAALLLAHETSRGLWKPIEKFAIESRERMPSAQPIVVEGHADFFPDGARTAAVQRLKERDIPPLQTRIKAETGVFVPGFSLRVGSDLDIREYRIRIHGVPVEDGRIAHAVADPYGYMIERAEVAIRGRLSSFVDLQSVDNLLAGRKIGDERRRCGFTNLLRLLVDDGVPIYDVDLLVEVCDGRELRGSELLRLAEDIRRACRDRLPKRDGKPVAVPEDLQARIAELASRDDPEPERSIPTLTLNALREELRALAEGTDGAVLVARPDIRPAVRRIVAIDMPSTPVLSPEELAEQASSENVFAKFTSIVSRS